MEATLKPRRRDLEEKKGKEIMDTKIKKNNQIEEVNKEDLKNVAETLSEVEKLPTETRIAMQYYIKGTLAGIQMMGDNASLVNAKKA